MHNPSGMLLTREKMEERVKVWLGLQHGMKIENELLLLFRHAEAMKNWARA